MNITFLIGNGFDVGLGMQSKYKDFFDRYCARSLHKKDDIKQLSETIGNDYDTWADFELQMGRYTGDFEHSDIRKLIAQFRDFETEFMQYLKDEQDKLSFDDTATISKMMLTGLKGFYSTENLRYDSSNMIEAIFKQRAGEERKYNFISFNYTTALEKCLETISDGTVDIRKRGTSPIKDEIGKIVHIHGVRNDCPIMGVCDSSQIANKELASNDRFLQCFVKPRINKAHRTNRISDASKLILNSTIICIYGMSLGATDKNWWQKILVWLNGSNERQLVIFDYDPNFSTGSQFDWIDKEYEILDKLSAYDEEKKMDIEKLRPRIHIAVHKNIFAMDLAKRYNQMVDSAIDMLKLGDRIGANTIANISYANWGESEYEARGISVINDKDCVHEALVEEELSKI